MTRDDDPDDGTTNARGAARPTRRAFVAMIGAAAAGIALRETAATAAIGSVLEPGPASPVEAAVEVAVVPDVATEPTVTHRTRWIGHC